MRLFCTVLKRLRALLPVASRRASSPGDFPRHRLRPSLEPLDSRELPSITAVRSIEILTEAPRIRLAPQLPLSIVVRVTGTDAAMGRPVTLEGTATELAAQGLDVNFQQRAAGPRQRIIQNLAEFRERGVVLVRKGVNGVAARIVALVDGFRSRAVPLLRDTRRGRRSCDGRYVGTFTGIARVPGLRAVMPFGPVEFHIVGRKLIAVVQPGIGSGELDRQCREGSFNPGGGSVQGASFDINVELRSDGTARADGAWQLLPGTNPLGAEGNGRWFAARF